MKFSAIVVLFLVFALAEAGRRKKKAKAAAMPEEDTMPEPDTHTCNFQGTEYQPGETWQATVEGTTVSCTCPEEMEDGVTSLTCTNVEPMEEPMEDEPMAEPMAEPAAEPAADAGSDNEYGWDIVTSKTSWAEAEASCAEMGKRLAVVDDLKKIEDFKAYLDDQAIKNKFWMGATDEEAEGEWVWVSGDSLTEEDWFDGAENKRGKIAKVQPGGKEKQNCMQAIKRLGKRVVLERAAWNDAACSSRAGYVCEDVPVPTTAAPTTAAPTPAPTPAPTKKKRRRKNKGQ